MGHLRGSLVGHLVGHLFAQKELKDDRRSYDCTLYDHTIKRPDGGGDGL